MAMGRSEGTAPACADSCHDDKFARRITSVSAEKREGSPNKAKDVCIFYSTSHCQTPDPRSAAASTAGTYRRRVYVKFTL
jgi:hypothetical protein